jgi:hypothetical protein
MEYRTVGHWKGHIMKQDCPIDGRGDIEWIGSYSKERRRKNQRMERENRKGIYMYQSRLATSRKEYEQSPKPPKQPQPPYQNLLLLKHMSRRHYHFGIRALQSCVVSIVSSTFIW